MAAEPPIPRRVVCAYPDAWLPGRWFQAYRRLKHGVERARLPIDVELRPVTALPEKSDLVLLVAGERARPEPTATEPQALRRLVVPLADVTRVVGDLLAEWSARHPDAERLSGAADRGDRRAVYVGIERVR